MIIRAELEKLFEAALRESTEESLAIEIESIRAGTDAIMLPGELIEETDSEHLNENFSTLIREMSIPQKIKLALYGNQTARLVLLRDSNRQIPLFVLENPRLTDGEISDICKNQNVDDQVLRTVASNSTWMKSYLNKVAIVSNPKVPVDISIKWVKFLQDRDLRRLAKSKNIPQVVATQCRKIVEGRAPNKE